MTCRVRFPSHAFHSQRILTQRAVFLIHSVVGLLTDCLSRINTPLHNHSQQSIDMLLFQALVNHSALRHAEHTLYVRHPSPTLTSSISVTVFPQHIGHDTGERPTPSPPLRHRGHSAPHSSCALVPTGSPVPDIPAVVHERNLPVPVR